MPTKEQTLLRMSASGTVAVIRAPSIDILPDLTEALVAGGVVSIEVTMSTPKAIRGIELLADKIGDKAVVGVGTVLDAGTAAAALSAGAQFVVCPMTDKAIIDTVVRQGKVMIAGAFTPTEIVNAWTLGSDVIKVFPSTALGPQYFRDLAGPLPQIKLTPTGGVDATNAGEWIKAGAVCVGAGSALVTKQAMEQRDWAGITKNAQAFTDAIKAARGLK